MAIHPSIDRALGLWASADTDSADAAARSLGTVLDGIRNSTEGDRAWHASSLARDGFPFELAFTSAGDGNGDTLRYTADVAGPEVSPHDRLTIALDLYDRLGGTPMPRALSRRLAEAQGHGGLKYGAWLSGRHRAPEAHYKLYAEIPREAGPVLAAWEAGTVGRPWTLAWRGANLAMVGWDGARLELYYRAQGLRPGEVSVLLDRVGLAHRSEELLDALETAYRRPVRRSLPSVDFGWSYSVSPTGEDTFTLYTFANAMFGGDGRIRKALLRLAEHVDWDLSLYRELSRPLAERSGFVTHHGLFGLVVAATGPPAISFGLTPPQHTYS